MIALLALGFTLFADGGDAVVLKRSYLIGDRDDFRIQVSPSAAAAPLGNAFEVSFKVVRKGEMIAWGSPTPYEHARKLAQWKPGGEVSFSEKGFVFLPDVILANDSALRPGEMEAVKGGSIKLLGVRDGVAQLRIWLPLADGTMLSEDSDVEIGTRRPNHGSGRIYRSVGGQLVVIRSFSFERIRTKTISPIRQEGD